MFKDALVTDARRCANASDVNGFDQTDRADLGMMILIFLCFLCGFISCLPTISQKNNQSKIKYYSFKFKLYAIVWCVCMFVCIIKKLKVKQIKLTDENRIPKQVEKHVNQ